MKRAKNIFFEVRELERKQEIEKEKYYGRIKAKRDYGINC